MRILIILFVMLLFFLFKRKNKEVAEFEIKMAKSIIEFYISKNYSYREILKKIKKDNNVISKRILLNELKKIKNKNNL